MKQTTQLLLFISLTLFQFFNTANAQSGQSEEISLFNSKGKPIAYIDTDDLTIYLWNGKPVAYLFSNDNKLHIYGFNGKHLGWFVSGIIRDHEGDAVGFKEGAVNVYTEYEPYKAYKQYKPYKSYKEYAPYMPYLSTSWSNTPLSLFLAQGVDD